MKIKMKMMIKMGRMEEFTATRLAPSPTGALHLGHARTFLITWWMARQAGAKIYMRMEDIDAGRAKPESVQQAYDDLRWLGMDWDAYTEPQDAKGKMKNEVVQSERQGLYDAALEMLWQRNAIYPCICTRADIAAAVTASASAPHETDIQPRYPGTCADRFPRCGSLHETVAGVQASTGKWPCLRLRLPDQATAFTDLIAGCQSLNVLQDAGDFPLTRFAMPDFPFTFPPAYQLACVVDDHAMGIDMVIRGDDLLASTPRQLILYEALGFTPPRFAHVPLVIGPDGKRLAKRHGESRIAQFRAAGISPERIVGWAAWRSGQLEAPREISPADLVPRFDLAKLPRHRITLGPEDFDALRR